VPRWAHVGQTLQHWDTGAYLKRPYEIFSDRNSALRDDGDSPAIAGANITRANTTSGDTTPTKDAASAEGNHPPES
jgi:hypothetical protein